MHETDIERDNATILDDKSTPLIRHENSEENEDEKAGFYMTVFNLFNQIEGLGLLAVPYAFRRGGWWTIPLLLLVAIASCISGRILSACLYDANGDRVRKSYHEAGEVAFGYRFKLGVVAMQTIGLAGVAITFVILIASSISSVADSLSLSHYICTAIATVVCLPLVLFNRLSYVAYLSIVSVLVLGVIGIAVPAESISQIIRDKASAVEKIESPSLDMTEVIGLLIFALSAHSTFPEHESAMKNPKSFPQALTVTYVGLASVKLAFGLVAWFAFGDETEEVVTDNLPSVPQKIVSVAIGINTWLTLPLVIVVFFRIAGHFRDKNVSWTFQIVERSAAVCLCGGCAAVLPHFALLVSIFGALSGTFLTFVFPSVMYIKIHGSRIGRVEKLGVSLLALFGLIGGTFGLVLSTRRLVREI